jgi:23S rRNA (adenine2030-N6)-methyltransferase
VASSGLHTEPMNYRHAFHAGNFADLVKHAALTVCLDLMARDPAPLTAIDTHGGAGGYDLTDGPAQRSGEAQQGIVQLLADPQAPEGFDALIAAVSRINPQGSLRLYPGSPALIVGALRPEDRLITCELRPDDFGALKSLLAPYAPAVEVLNEDGFATAAARAPGKGSVLVLVDPPYERSDDYERAVKTTAQVLARNSKAVVMIWLPLKDLETFDRFLRGLEGAVSAPVLVAETRLKPLDDPMTLNGCALAIINPPSGLAAPLEDICRWTAQTLGHGSGEGRLWNF